MFAIKIKYNNVYFKIINKDNLPEFSEIKKAMIYDDIKQAQFMYDNLNYFYHIPCEIVQINI